MAEPALRSFQILHNSCGLRPRATSSTTPCRYNGPPTRLDLTATTVDLVASGKESLTVLPVLSPIAGLNWDTTTVPDSRYDLRLIFRDATGAIVAQVPRNILLNNSIAWHSGVLQGTRRKLRTVSKA